MPLSSDAQLSALSELHRQPGLAGHPSADTPPTGCSSGPLAAAKATRPESKRIRSLEETEKIYDRYYWEKVIQEYGNGGKVVVCRRKDSDPASGFDCVMKIRSKDEADEGFRKLLERMLNFPPHPGVAPMREVLEDNSFYYVVMERALGGPLFDSLLQEFGDGVVPAAALKGLLKEILEVVGHVHRQGMLHRDIKPDNLVVQLSAAGAGATDGGATAPAPVRSRRVMLVDFDHADPDFHARGSAPQDAVFGTLRFNAPETFHGFFSEQSDLYSVGVLLYLLMAGKMPYDDAIFEEELNWAARMSPRESRGCWKDAVYRRMQEAHVDWQCDPWPERPACQSFCRTLLSFDPRGRPANTEEALLHPWFSQEDVE